MAHFDKITRIELDDAADFLLHRLPFIGSVDLVIQFGSGQSAGGLLDHEWNRAPLQEMPGLPKEESLAQQDMEIYWGKVGDFNVLVYVGRYHWYEGYGRAPILLPIWAAILCGARNFLLANAAGGIRQDLVPGSFMLIDDHINNLGVSPLAGHQHLLQSSYVDMAQTYSRPLRDSFRQAAEACGETVAEGVYMANTGPQFETAAEVRACRALGADAVGMSTVIEATAAHAMGARVLALSMIANRATGLAQQKISHREALEVGASAGKRLIDVIRRWLAVEATGIL